MQNDPFESMQQIQKIVSQITAPFKQINEQIELSSNPLIDQLVAFQQTLSPVVELAQRFEEISKVFQQMNIMHQKIQSLLKQISAIPKLEIPVPKDIYPEIDQLIETINDVIPDEEQSDSADSISINKVEQSKSVIWTWETLRWLIGIVLSMLISIYIAQQSSEQTERYNQELLNELRTQTRLLEINAEKQQQIEKTIIDCLNGISEHIPESDSNQNSDIAPENDTNNPDTP